MCLFIYAFFQLRVHSKNKFKCDTEQQPSTQEASLEIHDLKDSLYFHLILVGGKSEGHWQFNTFAKYAV